MLSGVNLINDIFKEPKEDYFNWNKYIEYFEREPAFSKEKSKDLIRIYTFLKNELGKEFLRKRYRDGRDLVNSWLWSMGKRYAELKWLCESLSYFKKDPSSNYTKLLGRLRSVERCNSEGMPFTIIGDSLRKAGLNVVFEPETSFRSNPDFKITNPGNGDVIYGEVSYQDESDDTEYKKDTYHILAEYFHSRVPIISFSGRIHNYAKREVLEKIGEQILKAKGQAQENKSIMAVTKEETHGVIEFVVAHADKLKELEEHEFTKRYQLNFIQGQGLNLNYAPRLLSKVKVKIKQHTNGFPLIVYVQMDQLFFMLGLFEPETLIVNLKKTICEFPHALGVCLYVTLGEKSEPVEEKFDDGYIRRKTIFDRNAEFFTLFIANDVIPSNVSKETLEMVYTSLGKMCE